jgi:hypothetical protein
MFDHFTPSRNHICHNEAPNPRHISSCCPTIGHQRPSRAASSKSEDSQATCLGSSNHLAAVYRELLTNDPQRYTLVH